MALPVQINPQNGRSIHDRIEEDRSRAAPEEFNWDLVRTFRKYYRGRQKGTLNADQLRIMQGVIGNRFSHNIAKKIVTEKANRLAVARFDVEDDTVREFLYDTWVKNQFPDIFADLMVAALRDGNAYIGLGWESSDDPDNLYGGRVTMSVERCWDGKTGTFLHYGDNNQPEYAVKEWFGNDGTKYRTIYWAGHIERYKMDGDGWRPYALPSDMQFVNGLPGMVPWVKRDGSPLGIPIIHFPNGNDDDSNYGASELDGGVLGFQDQINAIQHDITAVSLLTGSPRTTSKGFTLPKNEDGSSKQPKTGPGAHWHVEEDSAEWGTLEAGNIDPLVSALMLKLRSVCQMTDTPLHVITGEWPSGEALFRSEMPLVQAVEKLAKKAGPSGSSVMHAATEIANTFGMGPYLDETSLITTIFEPADKRDPLTLATFAEKVAGFVSEREVLRILHYSPEAIEKIMEERESEKEQAVERQQRLFNAGAPGTVQPGTEGETESTSPPDNDE